MIVPLPEGVPARVPRSAYLSRSGLRVPSFPYERFAELPSGGRERTGLIVTSALLGGFTPTRVENLHKIFLTPRPLGFALFKSTISSHGGAVASAEALDEVSSSAKLESRRSETDALRREQITWRRSFLETKPLSRDRSSWTQPPFCVEERQAMGCTQSSPSAGTKERESFEWAVDLGPARVLLRIQTRRRVKACT